MAMMTFSLVIISGIIRTFLFIEFNTILNCFAFSTSFMQLKMMPRRSTLFDLDSANFAIHNEA